MQNVKTTADFDQWVVEATGKKTKNLNYLSLFNTVKENIELVVKTELVEILRDKTPSKYSKFQ